MHDCELFLDLRNMSIEFDSLSVGELVISLALFYYFFFDKNILE